MKQEVSVFKEKIGKFLKPSTRKSTGQDGAGQLKRVALVEEPGSLNDILKDLIKIDQFIRASALVKKDGTILASAISTQISDALISVIATTVSNIAKDIIFSTKSGDLQHVTFAGSESIVHIAPVVADIYLVVLTGAKSKKGIIEVISRHVQKQTRLYLNV